MVFWLVIEDNMKVQRRRKRMRREEGQKRRRRKNKYGRGGKYKEVYEYRE